MPPKLTLALPMSSTSSMLVPFVRLAGSMVKDPCTPQQIVAQQTPDLIKVQKDKPDVVQVQGWARMANTEQHALGMPLPQGACAQGRHATDTCAVQTHLFQHQLHHTLGPALHKPPPARHQAVTGAWPTTEGV
jgi:hypothetical protein